MAKKKNSENIFDMLAQATGCSLLSDIDSVKYFVDTGNFALNYILSGKFIDGGIPGGKITEAYGPESSGKSLFGTAILRGAQKINAIPGILDCENASNKEFMEKCGKLDTTKVLRATPETLERAFNTIYHIIKQVREVKNDDTPIVLVYDSISVSPCERELKEVNLPPNYTSADWKSIVGGKEQPGERAKVCSREFRKANTVLEKNNATLFVINQTRSKVGILFGNPETVAGGGNALKFYASCRFKSTPLKQIKSKKYGNVIGMNFRVQNKKNKTHVPYMETENIQLLFDKGINPVSGLLSILLESERISPSGKKGQYVISEAYASTPEYKFIANKERNDVPVEVIIDNPKIVDATSSEEVKKYLSVFNFIDEEDIIEEDIKSSIEDELLGYDSNSDELESE